MYDLSSRLAKYSSWAKKRHLEFQQKRWTITPCWDQDQDLQCIVSSPYDKGSFMCTCSILRHGGVDKDVSEIWFHYFHEYYELFLLSTCVHTPWPWTIATYLFWMEYLHTDTSYYMPPKNQFGCVVSFFEINSRTKLSR